MSQNPAFAVPEEETEASALARSLEEATRNIYNCKRGFDQNNLVTALAHASQLNQALRTSRLGPSAYYELWMKVTEALGECEFHFDLLEEAYTNGSSEGHCVAELYETVQHCGNIIPRLYLLITVASTYIKSKRVPCKDILFDLVEMCKGVQHPMRGLFLRNYLLQVTKDKLPDVGSPYEGEGGSVLDAIDFTLQNFAEMNKLWVRMQHQGSVRERSKREKERKNLRQLVGTCLVRLSNLSGMTFNLYKEHVLPRILDQVVDCRDQIAQEYLMECIIQVFPDEYHVETLSMLLDSCTRLHKKVSVKDIIITIIRRIVAFAKSLSDTTSTSTVEVSDSQGRVGLSMLEHVFPLFSEFIRKMDKSSLKLSDTLALQVALVSLCATIHPNNIQHVDDVLSGCIDVVKQTLGTEEEVIMSTLSQDQASTSHIISLLSYPLETFKIGFLDLKNFSILLGLLEYKRRKKVAISICETLLTGTPAMISEVGVVDALFALLLPLINRNPEAVTTDGEQALEEDDEDTRYEIEYEQSLVLRIFHLIYSDDTDEHFKMLLNARKYFGQGGIARLEFTLPPLVYAALQLTERTHNRVAAIAAQVEADYHKEHNTTPSSTEGKKNSSDDDDEEDQSEESIAITKAITDALSSIRVKPKRMFALIHETIAALIEVYPEIALRLFINSAFVADRCASYEAIAYEFFAQAFVTYENEIADSKAQIAAFQYIIGALSKCNNFSKDNIDTLVSKAAQYSSKLLIKTDQCRAAYNCAHLFWNDDPNHPARNDRLVLQCLQRSLKVANACMGHQPHLFVEILNKYVYFYTKGCSTIELKYLRGLVEIIEDHLSNSDGSPQSRIAAIHHKNTIALLTSKGIFEEK